MITSCVVSRIERVCVRIIRGLADVDLTPEVSRESLRGAFNYTHTHTAWVPQTRDSADEGKMFSRAAMILKGLSFLKLW